MRTKFKIAGLIAVLLPMLFIAGCKSQKGKFEFINPTTGSRVLKGDQVELKLNFPNPIIDSVVYSVDGDFLESKTDTTSLVFDSGSFGYGSKRLSAKVYAEGKENIAYSDLLVVPPAPKPYAFEVVKSYPHDEKAFTQGLYYDNGTLYESTGRNGESTLRKVNLETGEVLQKYDLDEKYFGEGMTVMNDKIVMLTYTTNEGLVFDKNSFKLLKTFTYENKKEGWGLTYDGKRLIQSDGSSQLFFLDPVTFKETGSIRVFDDNGPVEQLNELEYIDGKVYANLYHGDRDEIVIIDPESGIVEGKINFVGMYDGKRASFDNEFNGIAYRPDTETLLVTGKLWTKLFEVKIKGR